MISNQLDALKDYKDEQMKREFYMAQIYKSILEAFEAMKMLEMETEILKHRAGLSQDQIKDNERMSAKPEPGSLPPLKVKTITVSIHFYI